MGHAQFRRVVLSLIDWDMMSSVALLVDLRDLTGCFFALPDIHKALFMLPDGENDEEDVELCLIPFVPRRGTPPSIEDADVIEAKLCLDLIGSLRGAPPSELFKFSDDDDGTGTILCLTLFDSRRNTPPSGSLSENPEDDRFLWFPLEGAELADNEPADGFNAVAYRFGDDSSDETPSSDRLLLR